MSRRSIRWRVKNYPQQYKPAAGPETFAALMLAKATAKFNSLIAPCAIQTERTADKRHIRYLHPTKGWRSVSVARFRGTDVLLPEGTS